jgi:hypothetical protein
LKLFATPKLHPKLIRSCKYKSNLMGSKIMQHLKLTLVSLLALTGLLLNACSSATQETATQTPTAATTSTDSEKDKGTKADDKKDGHSHSHKAGEHKAGEHSHGGQVVESGPYHLELVSEKEDKGVQLHFHLEQGEKHEPVSNAKVTAQVQLPDGSQQDIDFKYDAKGKEYTAELPGKAAGQYQLKLIADIGGEKVNGRFTVSQ